MSTLTTKHLSLTSSCLFSILFSCFTLSAQAESPVTENAQQVALGYEITQKLGRGTLPQVKLDQQVGILSDPSVLTFQTCFDFRKLKKGSSNLYLVYKTRFNKKIYRYRVRKTSPCRTLNITEAGKYVLYYFQTRSNDTNVMSQRTLFTVSAKTS